ncbi:MAG TPA: glycosyltransferase family 9 protein [Micromonosporaceae bacterium]
MRFAHPAALSGPPIDWAAVDRVLVVRPDNLGDVVLAGPAIRALRAALPTARIDLLASPAGAQVAPLLPGLDEVIEARVSWQQIDPRQVRPDDDTDLVQRLSERRYHAAIILTSFSQSPWVPAYLCQRAGIPVRVGTSKEFGGPALTHWVPAPPDETHQVDRALYVLYRVGVPPVGAELELRVPAAALRAAAGVRHAAGIPDAVGYAVVLPGASCAARRYPASRYTEVTRLLTESGRVVLVVGTDREHDLVREVARDVPGAVPVAGATGVPELAALIADADVVVCNNSGGAHLADALRVPVVVLFSGTEQVSQYGPRTGEAEVLTVPTWCAPCRRFTCPYTMACLDLDPSAVAQAALRLARRPVGVGRGGAPAASVS